MFLGVMAVAEISRKMSQIQTHCKKNNNKKETEKREEKKVPYSSFNTSLCFLNGCGFYLEAECQQIRQIIHMTLAFFSFFF